MSEEIVPQKPYGIVYCFTNKINGKEYVGQTVMALKDRIKNHLKARPSCPILHAALKKYGIEGFVVSVLGTASSKQGLDALEITQIQKRRSLSPRGYNLMTGGAAGRPNAEALARMRKPRSVPNWAKGLNKQTDERIAMRAAKQRGIPKTAAQRKALSEFKKGKPAPAVAASNRRRIEEKSANAKQWLITTPTGEQIKVFGLLQFCTKHGLNRICLSLTASRPKYVHRGYRCVRLG
jgi:group I intron endonuclease